MEDDEFCYECTWCGGVNTATGELCYHLLGDDEEEN